MSTMSTTAKIYFLFVICFFSAGTILLAPHIAHAGYLDPGSGSTAVQWIIASVAVLSKMKKNILTSISRIFRR